MAPKITCHVVNYHNLYQSRLMCGLPLPLLGKSIPLVRVDDDDDILSKSYRTESQSSAKAIQA